MLNQLSHSKQALAKFFPKQESGASLGLLVAASPSNHREMMSEARLPTLEEEVASGLSPTQGPEQHWRGAESWATDEAGRQLPENTKNSARSSPGKMEQEKRCWYL